MKQNVFWRRSAALMITLLLVVLLGVIGAGCTSSVKERRSETPRSEGTEMGRSSSKYYHFDDVLVPSELNYKPGRSFVYETPKFKTGILVFAKWWLDAESLLDFFTYHMEKDNWKVVNSFKGKESILNFSKPDKTCAIKIVEKWYGVTEVEIRVGPLGEKM